MYNASRIKNIEKIVQVGIRDFSEGENNITRESEGRILMYTEHEIKRSLLEGMNWRELAENIISHLPDNVYISYDIDGLQPWLCPNTGTPVPGGFQLEETTYLLEKLVESGRKIIGFDLCEVSPGEDEWDANVGARVLYKLCLLAAKSNGLEM
jgi:agmatinase